MSARFARLISPPAIVRLLRSAYFAFSECALASLGLIRLRRMCPRFGDCELASLDLFRLCARSGYFASGECALASFGFASGECAFASLGFASGECALASLGLFRLRRMYARFARLVSPPAKVRSLRSALFPSGECALASLG